MMGRARFAYAQARVQANYGRLATPAVWERLESVRDYGQFIQVATGTTLRPWLVHLGPASTAHEIELALRHRFRSQVQRVAAWLPNPWQGAAGWFAARVDLPAAAHLLAGRPALPWMHNDPVYAPLVAASSVEGARAVLSGSILAPLAQGGKDERELASLWRAHWQQLWPSPAAHLREPLERIAESISTAAPHIDEVRLLTRCFRREGHRPAAVFAYMGLMYREMERLRGALLRRRLLSGPI